MADGRKPGIPLSVELTTGWKALSLIRHELGVAQTASVLSAIMFDMRRGEPFGHLPEPADRCEHLSRKQIAPTVLLYRALCERMEPGDALALTREVAIAGARVFLKRMVDLLERERFEDMDTDAREQFVQDVGERFFNAKLSWQEISADRLRFTAEACCFPGLCEAAGAPELASLLCEGDKIFFGQDLEGVELTRPRTIAEGFDACPFTLEWKD